MDDPRVTALNEQSDTADLLKCLISKLFSHFDELDMTTPLPTYFAFSSFKLILVSLFVKSEPFVKLKSLNIEPFDILQV